MCIYTVNFKYLTGFNTYTAPTLGTTDLGIVDDLTVCKKGNNSEPVLWRHALKMQRPHLETMNNFKYII